jgi:hypothetical protein
MLALCEDAVGHIVSHVPITDRVCLALACRRFGVYSSRRTYVFASPSRLRWAMSLGYARLNLEWYAAYYSGDVDVVRAVLEETPGSCYAHVMNGAMLGGHLPLVQWVWRRTTDDLFATDPWHVALLGEHLPVLRWVLATFGRGWTSQHLYDSILYLRDLSTIDFLVREARVRYCDEAALGTAEYVERDDIRRYLSQ